MDVVVIGATGVLGPSLVQHLVERGRRVRVVGRQGYPPQGLLAPSAEWVRGDLLDPDSLPGPLQGADAVINLASQIPTTPTPRPVDWQGNDAVRDQGTANLLAAVQAARVPRLLQTSVHLVFGIDRGDEILQEDASVDPPPPLRSAVAAEARLHDAREQGRTQTTALRLGWLHARRSWHSSQLLSRLRAGALTLPAGRRWWWSIVSDERVAATIDVLLDLPEAPEVLHVADGDAIDVADLLTGVAEQLAWPRPPSRSRGATPELQRSVRMGIDLASRLGIDPGDPVAALAETAEGPLKEKATSVS